MEEDHPATMAKIGRLNDALDRAKALLKLSPDNDTACAVANLQHRIKIARGTLPKLTLV